MSMKTPEFVSKYSFGVLKRFPSTYIMIKVYEFVTSQKHFGTTDKKYYTLQIIKIILHRSLVGHCFIHDWSASVPEWVDMRDQSICTGVNLLLSMLFKLCFELVASACMEQAFNKTIDYRIVLQLVS